MYVDVQDNDSYILLKINAKKAKSFGSVDSAAYKELLQDYVDLQYNVGSIDCFSLAMDLLNDRLDGDLKRKPEGKDNYERFKDLKKDRN